MKVLRIRRFLLAAFLGALGTAASAQDLYSTRGEWLDDAAHPYSLEALRGTYTVATMAYGACRRVCSTSLRVVQELHRLAAQRSVSLNFVVFGLDPSEDKPSDWAALRIDQKMLFANVQFLSGSAAATRQIAQRLGVRYWHYGEHTMHDFRIVLVSPGGQVLRSMDHFDEDPTKLLP